MRAHTLSGRVAALLLGFGAWHAVAAVQFDTLQVGFADGRYHLEAEAIIAAPRDKVFAVITDYAHLTQLNDQILESEVLEQIDPQTVLVRTRVRGCVVVFCREMNRVERISERAPFALSSKTLPERSDIRFESASWQLDEVEGGTRLRYQLQLEPGYWVPAIGRGALQRQLRKSFEQTLASIETLAGPDTALR